MQACAESGTHYVDITGETLFVRRNMDTHGDVATRTGAKIISCCGYDSVPSDIGALVSKAAADVSRQVCLGDPNTRNVSLVLE